MKHLGFFLIWSLLFSSAQAKLAPQKHDPRPYYLTGFVGDMKNNVIVFETKHKQYKLKKREVIRQNPQIFAKKKHQNKEVNLIVKDSYVVSSRMSLKKWEK
jgi:hypothetical protein